MKFLTVSVLLLLLVAHTEGELFLRGVLLEADPDLPPSESRKTADELGIRAGGEPPLKTGDKPRNAIVASTKMRFKIPDMNA